MPHSTLSPMIAFQPSTAILVRHDSSQLPSSFALRTHQRSIHGNKSLWTMRNPRTRIPFNERFRRPQRKDTDTSLSRHNSAKTGEGNRVADFFGLNKDPHVAKQVAPNNFVAIDNSSVNSEKSQRELQFDDAGGNGAGKDGDGHFNSRDDRDDESENPNELTRTLHLTEAEGKKVTMVELQNLQAAAKIPLIGSLALRWAPLRSRLAANRRFFLQMWVEITVGCVTKTVAEVQGRGQRFWNEFDFYLSDMALEIFGDAVLVWLLSPVALWHSGRAGKSFILLLSSHFFLFSFLVAHTYT